MIAAIKRRLKKSSYVIEKVPIKNCVHYCGFKYGGQQYHPYETTIERFKREPENADAIKKQFIDFLKYYRPRYFNDAFDITLSKKYPLWTYPWHQHANHSYGNNWVSDPDDINDIITHFSEEGIPSYKIDREFFWMTRALKQMAEGYRPEQYSYIEAFKFERKDGHPAYLLLDGNHRVSALHALGETHVNILIKPASIVREHEVYKWPGVKNKTFTANDALALFNNYFDGRVCLKTSETPAQVLDYSNDYSQYVPITEP